jgi:NAD(P)H-hydrate epimerase
VIAGTPSFTGAAYLVGKAAYRGGCGLVHMATLESVHKSLSGQLVEAIWTILPDLNGYYDPSGEGLLRDKITQVDSLVLGPGWGLSDSNEQFLEKLLNIIPGDLPTVFDADGLKLLKRLPNWWKSLPKQTILTPHPGEMSILTDLEVSYIQSNRWEVAKEFAEKWGVTLLLKGAETVIADKTGLLWINPVSEPALATAGSGDVLSGLIGGVLAQGLSSERAAVTSAFLHSQAGMLAKLLAGTDVSITAMDILDSVAESFSLMN